MELKKERKKEDKNEEIGIKERKKERKKEDINEVIGIKERKKERKKERRYKGRDWN